MSSTNTLVLQAFIAALARLSDSLPAAVQQQLQQLSRQWGELLQAETTAIADCLDAIADCHPPLSA